MTCKTMQSATNLSISRTSRRTNIMTIKLFKILYYYTTVGTGKTVDFAETTEGTAARR